MTIEPHILDAIRNHSNDEFPSECCGLILKTSSGKQFVIRCQNSAKNPLNEFSISEQETAYCLQYGEIDLSYHSHPNTCKISLHDKIICNQSKIPMIVYFCRNNQFEIYKPNPAHKEYLYRNFEIGKNDCFTLVRDFYSQEFGVEISNYPRVEKWYNKYPNLIEDNFRKEGFFKSWTGSVKDLTALNNGDVILMNIIGQKNPVHMAVYVGNDLIMHHPRNSLSCIEKFDKKFKRMTKYIVRHESFA